MGWSTQSDHNRTEIGCIQFKWLRAGLCSVFVKESVSWELDDTNLWISQEKGRRNNYSGCYDIKENQVQ
eukprot:6212169-Pleurochrysis_carterae.AAC.3